MIVIPCGIDLHVILLFLMKKGMLIDVDAIEQTDGL